MDSLSSFRKPVSNFSLGIEIECLVSETAKCSTGLHYGFFYSTWDGSIDRNYGTRGIEFVSQPLTATWLVKEINKLWKKFPWTSNGSCGIHIHVSRKWLSEKKAKAIQKFYDDLTNEEQSIIFGRSTNEYCRREYSPSSRYHAVNFTNKNTIEFRMFASGDAQWACYCVKLAEYLIRNARHLNITSVLAFKEIHYRPLLDNFIVEATRLFTQGK